MRKLAIESARALGGASIVYLVMAACGAEPGPETEAISNREGDGSEHGDGGLAGSPVQDAVAQETQLGLKKGTATVTCVEGSRSFTNIKPDDVTDYIDERREYYGAVEVDGLALDTLVNAYASIERDTQTADPCATYEESRCSHETSTQIPSDLVTMVPVSVSGNTLYVHCGYYSATGDRTTTVSASESIASSVTFHWWTI